MLRWFGNIDEVLPPVKKKSLYKLNMLQASPILYNRAFYAIIIS